MSVAAKVKKYYKILLSVFLIVAAGIFLYGMALIKNPDADMYWMLSVGRDIVKNRHIPSYNTLIYTQGYKVIIQQWLLAVINYTVVRFLGMEALTYMALLLYIVCLFLVYRLVCLYTDSLPAKTITLILCGLSLLGNLSTRPAILTCSILLYDQICVKKYKDSGKAKRLLPLPVSALLLVNFHASHFFFFFLLLMPHLVPDFTKGIHTVRQQIKQNGYLAAMSALSLLMGFINPYGYRGVIYLFYSFNSSRLCRFIAELQCPKLLSVNAALTAVAVLLLFACLLKIPAGEWKMDTLYMAAGCIILSVPYVRNLWFLTFAFIMIIPQTGEVITACRKGKRIFTLTIKETKKPGCLIAEAVTSSVITLSVLVIMADLFLTLHTKEETPMPAAIADYLCEKETDKENLSLFTTFNSGGYMQWRGFKTYIDARPELYMKNINGVEDRAEEYYAVHVGEADFGAFLEKHGFSYLVMEKGSDFDKYARTDTSLEILLDEEHYVLYRPVAEKE